MQDTAGFKALFLKTAKEHITTLQEKSETLQQDAHNISAIEQMHIAAHSLKGESILMGYQQFGNISRLIEQLLKNIQEKPELVSPPFVHALVMGTHDLSKILQSIETTNTEPDVSKTVAILQQLVGERTKV